MQGPVQIAIRNAALLPKRTDGKQWEWGEVIDGGLIDPRAAGTAVKLFPCHQAQIDVLASKAKFTMAFAGSGGGKTILIPLWLFKRIVENPKGRFLVVSPTLKTFRDSELQRHILDTFEGTQFEGEWKEQKAAYILPTGGEIVVKTVGDGSEANRLRGGQYHAAVIDECAIVSAGVWEEVRRRVSNHNGPTLAVTTPDTNGWILEAKQESDKGNPDYYVRHWSKLDNPTVSKEDVERERAKLPEWKFKRMIEGEFASIQGLVFDCFSDPQDAVRYPVVDSDSLPSPPVRFFGGNDWGYKPDPAAVLMIAQCENGNYYVCDEIYGTEITPDDMAVRVRKMIDKWAVRVDSRYAAFGGTFVGLYSDTSRPEELKMFRNAGITIRNKRVTDVLAGIAITDTWLRCGKLKVLRTCTNLIRELGGYQWDTARGGDFKDHPRDKDNHTCDALRYAISSHLRDVMATPAEAYVPTNDDAEREKLVRYRIVTGDIDAEMKEREAELEKQRLAEMIYGTDDDDDPMGVWTRF